MQLLRYLALPLALLYGIAVRIRNFCYDIHLFPSTSFATPTICIGNLRVGGTGKTPMVEYLLEMFGESKKVAVLSRGYRRKTQGFVMAQSSSTARDIGDEPLQIFHKFPGISVAVDANRHRGITELEKRVAPELILLDDAFQHRKVRPDFAILLTTYGDLYCDDFYLPTGNLRDSRREARRADLIVVTKCPKDLPASEREKIGHKLQIKPHQQLLFAALDYEEELKGGGANLNISELEGRSFLLVTGIANAQPLVSYLKCRGLAFEHLNFGDHHSFSEKEIASIIKYPLVVTTEKDYRRIGRDLPNLCYLSVSHRFLGKDGDLLLDRLGGL